MRESNVYRRMVFEVYCALMLVLLFLQRSPHLGAGVGYAETLRSNLNLIPGVTIHRFMRVWDTPVYHRAAIVNLIGNVIMFIPLGFGLPWVFERLRRLWKTLLVSAGIIILVETIQLVTLLGHCDVDDLILNLIGVSAGYLLYFLIYKLGVRSEE